MNLHVRPLAAAACTLAAVLAALPPAAAAEAPTPQAVAANAEFLATAPPPPVPGKVCVVDSGVDLNTDVAPAVIERWSIVDGPVDDMGTGTSPKHGTYVAGVIASQLDGAGSVGIWPHARIISVRVFDGGGTDAALYVEALDLCVERGASVANLSLGGLEQATLGELQQLHNRIDRVRKESGVAVVAAAGNNSGEVTFPARLNSVFAVAAADSTGRLCAFSSRGQEVDVAALGCGVELTLPGGARGSSHGTSFAAPVVAATLAALRSYSPGLTGPAAEQLIATTARAMPGGRQLDTAAAFRVAGLSGLLETTSSDARSAPATPMGAPVSSSRPAPLDSTTQLRIGRPRLRSRSFVRGLLRVVVAGIPNNGRALFLVNGRPYRRADGALRVRVGRRPRSILVRNEIPGIGRSSALRVRLPRLKPTSP